MYRLYWNIGAWTCWNPQGLSRPVMGLLYHYYDTRTYAYQKSVFIQSEWINCFLKFIWSTLYFKWPGIATRWTVRGSNPGAGEMLRTRLDGPPGPIQLPVIWIPALFAGIKQPGRDVNHQPPPSSTKVTEKIYFYFRAFMTSHGVNFSLRLPHFT